MTYLLSCDDNLARLGWAVRAKHAAGTIPGSPSEGVRNVHHMLGVLSILAAIGYEAQRHASGAAGSRSEARAEAGGSRLHAIVQVSR